MKKIFLFVLFLLYTAVAPAGASTATITLDAGWIEWSDEYVRASNGFHLRYEGTTMAGSELVYNTLTEEYELNETGVGVCKKEHPHYQIFAKQMKIYPKERIVFTGAKIQVGTQVIPIPFQLVLTYENGEYTFPTWLPEMFYNEKGLGIRFRNAFTLQSRVILSSLVEVSALEGIDLKLWSSVGIMKNLSMGTEIQYDGDWTGRIKVNWREQLQGWQGFVDLALDEKDFTKQASLDYVNFGWRLGAMVNESISSFRTNLELSSLQTKLGGIQQKSSAGVRRITEKEVDGSYNEYYVSNLLTDQYNFRRMSLNWSWDMTHLFIEGHGWKGQALGKTAIAIPVSNNWSLGLGYERSIEWGIDMPYKLDSYKPSENAEFQVRYSARNSLDEGWDFSLKGKYNLLNTKYEQGEIGIVKAFDCFDVVVDLDIASKRLESKIALKF